MLHPLFLCSDIHILYVKCMAILIKPELIKCLVMLHMAASRMIKIYKNWNAKCIGKMQAYTGHQATSDC